MRRLVLAPLFLLWLGGTAGARCRACLGGPATLPPAFLATLTLTPNPRPSNAFVPQGMEPRPLRLDDITPLRARLRIPF